VRETLRLFPPATILNRHVESKGGFMLTPDCYIPPNTTTIGFLYGYQRSEEYWPEVCVLKNDVCVCALAGGDAVLSGSRGVNAHCGKGAGVL
jgi:hypothetical protein